MVKALEGVSLEEDNEEGSISSFGEPSPSPTSWAIGLSKGSLKVVGLLKLKKYDSESEETLRKS